LPNSSKETGESMAKIVRYLFEGHTGHGELIGTEIKPLQGTIGRFSDAGRPLVNLTQVRLLAPTMPTKIVAIGPGYRAQLKGGPAPSRPYYWIKPATAVIGPDDVIERPADIAVVCHESELAIVIGKVSKDVPIAQASEHIFGYTCANDVSAGNLLNIEEYVKTQYLVDGKIFDTFAPIGPCIETNFSADNAQVVCRVNGVVRQNHNTSDFIFSPAQLVHLISSVLTLYPGDMISTGSPPGMGPLVNGDVVEVEIDGIGTLRNTVRAKRPTNIS
jgi:2-keto-4-pentenoate hydratase/2-oxohepta-3-ene-1,7-dioic acid hydratase in catechol pathway